MYVQRAYLSTICLSLRAFTNLMWNCISQFWKVLVLKPACYRLTRVGWTNWRERKERTREKRERMVLQRPGFTASHTHWSFPTLTSVYLIYCKQIQHESFSNTVSRSQLAPFSFSFPLTIRLSGSGVHSVCVCWLASPHGCSVSKYVVMGGIRGKGF